MLISQLTRWAIDWATVTMRKGGTLTVDYAAFIVFKPVFDYPEPEPIQEEADWASEEAESIMFSEDLSHQAKEWMGG